MNLTVVVDDDVLKGARLRAAQEETSVNAVVREALEAYASDGDRKRRARRALRRIWQGSTGYRGDAAWTRDELHER